MALVVDTSVMCTFMYVCIHVHVACFTYVGVTSRGTTCALLVSVEYDCGLLGMLWFQHIRIVITNDRYDDD